MSSITLGLTGYRDIEVDGDSARQAGIAQLDSLKTKLSANREQTIL